MISKSELLLYYKRKPIQQAIVEHSKDKEVVGSFGGSGFGKRPDIIQYPAEILEAVKQGITSFHCSEELWNNTLQLSPNLNRKQLDQLRKSWNLVLDIDCDNLEYSKIAAHLIIQALKYHNIQAISIKFSGNHGFHIGVPYESFPKMIIDKGKLVDTRLLFPEAPRTIANYLKAMIRDHLKQEILKIDNTVGGDDFDPFSILEIDTILISSRHLYRAPYSFNEKSGLISVPIDPNRVLDFDKKTAISKDVLVDERYKFLDRSKCKENEAKQLFVQAFDFDSKKLEKEKYKQISEQEKGKWKKDFEEFQEAVPEQFFPPCIKFILKGLEDGKKRSLFILINFLKSVNWPYDKIEKRIQEWNKVNKETLRENYIVGQLRYQKHNKDKILPPNCENQMYYKDLHVCQPDNLCNKIKNPVNYSIRKVKYMNFNNKKKTKKQQKKQKTA